MREPTADSAQSDDSDANAPVTVFARPEVGAFQLDVAPTAGLDVAIARVNLLQEREHQGHRSLRDTAEVGLGRAVRDQDAEIGRRFHVDVVDAYRVFRDQPQVRKRAEKLAIHDAVLESGAQ